MSFIDSNSRTQNSSSQSSHLFPQRALVEFLRGGKGSNADITVIGDIVLDCYMTGDTSRVSREAPVPVVVCNPKAESNNLGGAGNVVANLRGINAHVRLGAMIADDAQGQRIRELLTGFGIGISGASGELALWPRTTPTLSKTRLICGGQQVARFDNEEREILPGNGVVFMLDFLDQALNAGTKAVILSDYGLGCCTPELCQGVIARASAHDVPVFVDPRGADWSKYRGATIATPNLSELSVNVGQEIKNNASEIAAAGAQARDKNNLNWLLVTRGSQGMDLISESGVTHIPARPVEVFDVSGAGDTVIALLAAIVASDFAGPSLTTDIIERAARMANEAAQFVITRAGTYAINIHDFLTQFTNRTPFLFSPVMSRDEAAKTIRVWQENGLKVIFTNGCFDVLHAGHLDSLKRARLLGDRLVVGLNSDRSVRALKGPSRPVHSEALRAELLAALRPVDLVVIFDEDTPSELLEQLRPDVLAKGGDYKAETLPGREFVNEVVILPLLEGHSTTNILNHNHGSDNEPTGGERPAHIKR